MTLTEAMGDPKRHAALVDACAKLVDDEVAARSGLSGMAIRTAYAAFQRIKPGITRAAVTRLLPELSSALDPHWRDAVASGDPDRHFRTRESAIAADLLAVTDRIAERSDNRVLVGLYRSLHSRALANLIPAVPKLPALIRAHTVV